MIGCSNQPKPQQRVAQSMVSTLLATAPNALAYSASDHRWHPPTALAYCAQADRVLRFAVPHTAEQVVARASWRTNTLLGTQPSV